MHQHILIALEVAEKLAEMSLKTIKAGDLALVLVFRPAVEARELAPAPAPAAVPQAPFRTLQTPNRLIGKMAVWRAEAACRLQRMLETHGGVPPIQHGRGIRQCLALQPPQASITIA
jgi:hypothetical protein